jgi:site-specific recombinase XerD
MPTVELNRIPAVIDLARYYHRSPDQLGIDEIQAYFRYLVKERDLSGATRRLYRNAIRFLYLEVVKWPSFDVSNHVIKGAQHIPELLTRREVAAILGACSNPKHRIMRMTCYVRGLRVSEWVATKVRRIDGERHPNPRIAAIITTYRGSLISRLFARSNNLP